MLTAEGRGWTQTYYCMCICFFLFMLKQTESWLIRWLSKVSKSRVSREYYASSEEKSCCVGGAPGSRPLDRAADEASEVLEELHRAKCRDVDWRVECRQCISSRSPWCRAINDTDRTLCAELRQSINDWLRYLQVHARNKRTSQNLQHFSQIFPGFSETFSGISVHRCVKLDARQCLTVAHPELSRSPPVNYC